MADPSSTNFPIVSDHRHSPAPGSEFDVQNPPAPPEIITKDDKVITAMNAVVQSRLMLEKLGDRPDHETVDAAKLRLAEIDANRRLKNEGEIYKAVIALDEMHEVYGRVLVEAEWNLERIYAAKAAEEEVEDEDRNAAEAELEEFLTAAREEVDLGGKELTKFPEALGKLKPVVVLNLSRNQLQTIPDSIAGLENIQELNLSDNRLQSLPDSIGLLFKLKSLDVSGNQLAALPNAISHCRSLVKLNASFNNLTYLPTDIGFELINLTTLDIHLNRIRFLPTSIGGMISLRVLDVHFNALHGLPTSIGKLTNLEILNLSGNFKDFTDLPEALCDVVSLKELDVSHNQIRALPDKFGQLVTLTKLNLDENPLVIPPKEIVVAGVEVVKAYMEKRWMEILMEEEREAMVQLREQKEMGLFSRFLSNIGGHITSGYSSGSKGKWETDPCLDQLL